jgi:hypothetical protein
MNKKKGLILLFTFLISTLHGQQFNFLFENDTSVKRVKVNDGQTIRLGNEVNLAGDTLQVIVMEGKLCAADQKEVSLCTIKRTTSLFVKDKLIKKTTEDYRKTFKKLTMKWEDVTFISKEKGVGLKGFHGLAILGATAFIAIINPIISTNFSKNTVNGDQWLRNHLISLAVVAEGIIVIALLRHRKIYLQGDQLKHGVWNIKSVESVSN